MIEKKTILMCISFIIIVCFNMQNEISIVICAVESEEIELTEAIMSIAF